MASKKNKRKALSKSTRFEVLKRDSFTCQYCGHSAPDVILQIDHIKPVKHGGEDSLLNYITSCKDCNQGKGSKELSDHSTLAKQKRQLEELNERKEQMKMMVEWREELENLEDDQIKHVDRKLNEITASSLNSKGWENFREHIRKFGFDEISESTRIALNQYYDGTKESLDKAIKYVPRIAARRVRDQVEPYMKTLYYIRGILRNRLTYCNDERAIRALREAHVDAEATLDDLKEIALDVKNWTEFRKAIYSNYGVEL
jgi:hypothetical protein